MKKIIIVDKKYKPKGEYKYWNNKIIFKGSYEDAVKIYEQNNFEGLILDKNGNALYFMYMFM